MTGAGQPTPTLSMQLVRILEQIRNEALPDLVIEKAKTCCLDYLAACLGAAGSRSADIALDAAMVMGHGRSTLIGRREKGTLLGAALYNGWIAHAEELDDSHRYVSGLHPGAVVIPAALAAGEEQGLTGMAFIKAIVCGYEAAARICRCIEQGHRARGFHSTGTVGPFGACAAAGAALDLDTERQVQAIGIAGSMGAGLFAFLEDGATVKHLHPGRAALDGLLAALTARAGLTGPRTVLEAAEGFFRAYADSYNTAPLLAPLEGAYEIGNAYHKLHSVCGHAFPAIDAALHLRKKIGNPAGRITSIDVQTYRAASVLENRRPRSIQEARFSIPFLVALVMREGAADRKALLSADLSDPALLDLTDRVALRENPELQSAFPRLRACIMGIRTPDDRELTCRIDSPRGMPDNPVSSREIENKFMAESAGTLDDRRAGRVLDAIRDLDKLPSVKDLTGLLSG